MLVQQWWWESFKSSFKAEHNCIVVGKFDKRVKSSRWLFYLDFVQFMSHLSYDVLICLLCVICPICLACFTCLSYLPYKSLLTHLNSKRSLTLALFTADHFCRNSANDPIENFWTTGFENCTTQFLRETCLEQINTTLCFSVWCCFII